MGRVASRSSFFSKLGITKVEYYDIILNKWGLRKGCYETLIGGVKKMGMVTEWTFTKNGRKTEAQRTMMQETYGPISLDDHKKLQDLADYLVELVMKSMAKE